MLIRDAIEEYRYAILSKSERTQKLYLQKLELFVEWCESENLSLEDISPKQVARYIDYRRKQGKLDKTHTPIGKPHSTHTLQSDARAIKVFLNWCSKEEDLEKLVSRRSVERIIIPKLEEKVIEVFTSAQIRALFAACEGSSSKALAERDRTILALLLDTGIRASELCRLTLGCVFLKNPHDAYIKVHGKRNKWREVGLGMETVKLLRKYIAHQRKDCAEDDYVFLGRFHKPMTVNSLEEMIYRLGTRAQITGVRCSPHTFRHTFAVFFLEAGGDIYRLSRLMGHTELKITEGYLKAMKQREARQAGISVLDRLSKEKPNKKPPALQLVKGKQPLEHYSVVDHL